MNNRLYYKIDSNYPLSELFNIKLFGFKIIRKYGGRTVGYWVDNNNFKLNNIVINIDNYKLFVKNIIKNLNTLINKLLMGYSPDLGMSL